MCVGGGSSASQDALVRQQNAQAQRNFDAAQRLQQAGLDQSAQQFADNLAFQESALAANLGLQQSEINRQIENERLRKSRIEGAKRAIEEAFSGRDSLFDQIEADTLALNTDELNKNRGDANRNAAFNLERAGRRFDSLEKDTSAKINERFNEGLLDAKLFSKNIANNARAQDSALRSSLLSSAASGAFDGGELVSGAGGSLDAIANTRGGLSGSNSDRGFFSDIPASINQFSNLFGNNRGFNPSTTFRPGSASRGSRGTVSNVGF